MTAASVGLAPGAAGVPPAIVVVSYGSADLLSRNLSAVQDEVDHVLCVVVDNFTDDAERALVRALAAEKGWVLETPSENLGFGAGMNLGVQRALSLGAQEVVLLNPDASLDRASFDRLVTLARNNPMALIAPVIVRPDGSTWSTGSTLDLRSGDMVPRHARSARGDEDVVPWLSGACLAMHRTLWEKLGGFVPDYFLYWEDVDLSFRTMRLGGRLIVDERSRVTHDEGATHRDGACQRAKSDLYYYFNVRNRLLFARLNLDESHVAAWKRRSLSAAVAILLRGGRRQFLRPTGPLGAAIRGTRDGWRLGRPAQRRELEPGHQKRAARVYHTVRTAHLERSHQMAPAQILYGSRNYDFDEGLAVGLDLVAVPGPVALARHLWRTRPAVVEVNEPLMRVSVRRTAAAVGAVRAADMVRRGHTRVVTYAIENRDPFAAPAVSPKDRLRRTAEALLTRVVARRIDRIAYGTHGARSLYASGLHGRLAADLAGAPSTLIPALPAACGCGPLRRDEGTVVFVGAFLPRKGIPQLLAAWPEVIRRVPSGRLTLLGQGPMEPQVRSAADQDPSIELVIEPPRAQIHERLRAASVLVLLSQPAPRWREQVGLPLTEGLSHGCLVLASSETGLATWLGEHGHQVLPPDGGAQSTGRAIADLLADPRPAADILADLPIEDGRLAADSWLMSSGCGRVD